MTPEEFLALAHQSLQKNLTPTERQILDQACQDLSSQVYFPKIVQEVKKSFNQLALSQQISTDGLVFFTELSRRMPETGIASIWNKLITKKV